MLRGIGSLPAVLRKFVRRATQAFCWWWYGLQALCVSRESRAENQNKKLFPSPPSRSAREIYRQPKFWDYALHKQRG
jgi:hypothetical protein